MRTTVNIDDGLLETAKQRAKEQHRTLGELVEEGLRHLLAAPLRSPATAPPLAVFRRPGRVRPGVDLSTNAGLYAAMYADEDARYAGLVDRERP